MDRHLHEDLFQQMKMNREMFEGKDYPTQWALNPSTYQNMSNDQVDWAALAQQWIQMKETVVPPAPPPPSLSNDSPNDERGEAPMDMDTKDDDVPPAPPAPNISGSENWNQNWSQWGQWNASAPGGACWEWSGVPPPGVIMGADGRPMGIPGGTMPAVPPAPNISGRPGFSIPPPSGPGAPPYPFNSVGSSTPGFNQIPGYWPNDHNNSIPPGHVAPPFLKGMRHPRMPHLRNDPNRMRNDKEKTPDEDSSMTIDAAKRRQLPAWIREGLEKMEREKHRAVERERQEILRQQELEARKIIEEEARAIINPSKSKFDSDSEKEVEADPEVRGQEEEPNDPESSPGIVVRARRSRFRDAGSPESRLANNDSPPTTPVITNTPPVKRSREEILQDVMLKVRRSLTEILLEVTNEEISSVCREVWSRARVKAPAGDSRVASSNNTAPLAQITRKLGLGIYGDSNSESEEEQENQMTDDDEDSEAELKETLRRRQAAFKKTEEEIEARLAEDEEAELRINSENTSKYENHMGNDTSRAPVDENEINNERESSETRSNGGHTPRRQIQSLDNEKINEKSSSSTIDSTTNSTTSDTSSSTSSSSSSDSEYSNSSRRSRKKKYRKHKSRSRSRGGRRSRSSSRSRNKRSKHKRSLSITPASRKSGKSKNNRENKRRSRSRSYSRSRSRRRSRSPSRRSSRDRRRLSRSRSRNRKRSSRSYSRERGRSRSYGHYSSSKRRTRSRSKERRRSRSKSHSHRDGKKSSHRYRD